MCDNASRDAGIKTRDDLLNLIAGAIRLQLNMHAEATFSLFVRKLPERRDYLLACGLEEVRVPRTRGDEPWRKFVNCSPPATRTFELRNQRPSVNRLELNETRSED